MKKILIPALLCLTFAAGCTCENTIRRRADVLVIGGTTYTAADASVEVSPAEAASFSVQEDTAFDEDDFSTAVDAATGRYAGKLASISISDTTGGSVYDGNGRVSTGTKYYISGSRSYLISNLSFKTSTSSSSSSPYFL